MSEPSSRSRGPADPFTGSCAPAQPDALDAAQPVTGPTPPDASPARLRADLRTAQRQNADLVSALKAVRAQLLSLRDQVAALSRPPSTFGQVLEVPSSSVSGTRDAAGAPTAASAQATGEADPATQQDPAPDGVDVLTGGRRMRLPVSPEIDPADLVPGREVRLNESLAVVEAAGFEQTGDVVVVHEVLDEHRVVVTVRDDEQRVCRLAGPMRDVTLRQGDTVLLDTRSSFVHEVVPRAEVDDLMLEEVPDISYDDIGGLAGQIEAIRDSVELPYLHPELFREHRLRPPKGVLLYGPPGCGKTLIAKAVAASLARQSAARDGRAETTSYFLNIKGPELLNKYVGETERQIRLIFARAREHASSGAPVVVFFDEMDSLFRTRGSGLSSDVETTIVPQLLAEIDGVERLDNVIVIGASNREDMIDPAILRPGRLDAKIKIERPDADGARDIFGKYLTDDLPVHATELAAHGGSARAALDAMITATVERMYARTPDNEFLEVVYAAGGSDVLYYGDFTSGAMIQNVVNRAKRAAIKDLLLTGDRGLRTRHLLTALETEFRENEDLPNTSSPDEWSRLSGRRGGKVAELRRLAPETPTG